MRSVQTPLFIVLGIGGACLTLLKTMPQGHSDRSESAEQSHRVSVNATGPSGHPAASSCEAGPVPDQMPEGSGGLMPAAAMGGHEASGRDPGLSSMPPPLSRPFIADRRGGLGRIKEQADGPKPRPGFPSTPAGPAEPVGPARRKVGPGVAGPMDLEAPSGLEPELAVPYSPIVPSIPATIPAALAWMPPNALDDTGTAQLARLAEAFLKDVEGGTEDPLNPEYQERWFRAQEESDARMRASLGGQAWLNHHREVHHFAGQQSLPLQKPSVLRQD